MQKLHLIVEAVVPNNADAFEFVKLFDTRMAKIEHINNIPCKLEIVQASKK